MTNSFSPFSGMLWRRGVDPRRVVGLILSHAAGDAKVDVIQLSRIPAFGALHQAARGVLQTSPWLLGEKPDIESPYIPISGDWEAFLSGQSARFRKQVRQRLQRVAQGKDISVRRLRIRDGADPALDEMLTVSAHSWKRRIGTHIGGIPNGASFCRALCDEFGPTGEVELWQLLKNDTPIACEFGIRYRGTSYPLRADYRADHAHLSPGGLLECHILKALFEDAPESIEYNSCANRYPYLLRWTQLTRRHVTVLVFPDRPLSRVLHVLEFRVIPALRFVRNQLRSLVSRVRGKTAEKARQDA